MFTDLKQISSLEAIKNIYYNYSINQYLLREYYVLGTIYVLSQRDE